MHRVIGGKPKHFSLIYVFSSITLEVYVTRLSKLYRWNQLDKIYICICLQSETLAHTTVNSYKCKTKKILDFACRAKHCAHRPKQCACKPKQCFKQRLGCYTCCANNLQTTSLYSPTSHVPSCSLKIPNVIEFQCILEICELPCLLQI